MNITEKINHKYHSFKKNPQHFIVGHFFPVQWTDSIYLSLSKHRSKWLGAKLLKVTSPKSKHVFSYFEMDADAHKKGPKGNTGNKADWGNNSNRHDKIAQAKTKKSSSKHETKDSKTSKDTVVFFHGLGDNKFSFISAAELLSQHYRVIVPDLPGFGESRNQKHHNYSLEYYSQSAKEFFDLLKLDRVHLVGNSLGGAIALQMAIDFPERLHSLTVLNPGGVIPLKSDSLYDLIYKEQNPFIVKDVAGFDSLMAKIFAQKPPMFDWIKPLIYKSYLHHQEWYLKILYDLVAGSDEKSTRKQRAQLALNPHLAKIKAPTFVLWGLKDGLFPAEVAHILKAKIARSTLKILANHGHSLQIESPLTFYIFYKDFLDHLQLETNKKVT